MKSLSTLIVILALALISIENSVLFGQACDASTPSYTADLTGNPDSLWISPQTVRSGLCCGLDPSERPPARCVEIYFTLDDDAEGIIFDIIEGAVPPGALFFQINCQGRYQFGERLCLSGSGPFRLTFCKPGNNPNVYGLQSIGKPDVTPPIAVSDGCSGVLNATGFDPATIQWTSVPSDPTLEGYLDCLTCETVNATYQVGAPDSVTYEVTGQPLGGCSNITQTLQTKIYFVNDKTATINPEDPSVCFGATDATLTINGTGGKPPYTYLWSTGETAQSIDVGEGTYWVEIFDNSSCPTAKDTVDVGAFLIPIEANAGTDIEICQTATSVTLNGSVIEATGGQWSSLGGGLLGNDTDLATTYQPTAAEKAGGTASLVLTTTGNRGCPGDDDTVQIILVSEPTLDIGNDTTLCANNSTVNLSALFTGATGVTWTGAGTFTPDNSSPNIAYTPTAAEITAGTATISATTTGSAYCNPVSASKTLTFTPAPTVDAGVDDTVCSNNDLMFLSGSVTVATGAVWSAGSGLFFPSTTGLVTSYDPTLVEVTDGFVDFTLTSTGNGNCNPVSDVKRVTIVPAPVVDAGPDDTVCISLNTVDLSGTISGGASGIWIGGNGSFTDNMSLNTTYNINATDKTFGFIPFELISISDGRCLQEKDTKEILITPSPTVDAGPDLTVCANNANVSLSASVTLATGVTWSTSGTGSFTNINSFNTDYIPSNADTAAGSITITATSTGNGDCTPGTDDITLTFSPAPLIDAGGPLSVCANNATITLSGYVSPPFTGTWVGGSGIFGTSRNDLSSSYTLSSAEITAGSFQLTLESANNGNCNLVSDVLDISVTPAPTITEPNNVTVCADNPGTSLTATFTIASGVQWTGNGGTFSPDSTSTTVTYTPSAQELSDSSTTLFVETTGNGNCLAESHFVTISYSAPPTIDIGGDLNICMGTDTVRLNAIYTTATGISWSTSGSGTFSPSAADDAPLYTPSIADTAGSNSITISATTTGNGGCNTYSDAISMNFLPAPAVNAGADRIVCSNELPFFNVASGSPGFWIGQGGNFYPNNTFSNAEYEPTAVEIASGSTFLIFESYATPACPADRDTLNITFTDGPVMNAGTDQIVCTDDGQISLNGTALFSANVLWSTNGKGSFDDNTSLTPTYTMDPSEQGYSDTISLTFRIQSNDPGGCPTVFDNMTAKIAPSPFTEAGQPTQTFCKSETDIALSGSVGYGSGVLWTSDGTGIFTNPNSESTTYQPSSADTSAGSVILFIESTGNGNCQAGRDTLTINFQDIPVITNISSPTQCVDVVNIPVSASVINATGLVWSSTGYGGFNPSNTGFNPIYQRSVLDTVGGSIDLNIETTGNGVCPPTTDILTINFTPPIAVNAGGVIEACETETNIALSPTLAFASGGTWSSNTGGSFSPDANTLNATYTPSASDLFLGKAIITLTSTGNGTCQSGSDELTINFNPQPVVAADPDQLTICSDASSIGIKGAVTNATGGSWTHNGNGTLDDPNSLTTDYNIDPLDTNGTVTFYLTTTGNGNCASEFDSTVLIFTPRPTINAGLDQLACEDDASAPLLGAVQGATGTFWSCSNCTGTITSPSVTSTDYFINTLDITNTLEFIITSTGNGTCQAVTDTAYVDFRPRPVVNLASGTICANSGNNVQLTGVSTGHDSLYWTTTGSGSYSPASNILSPEYQPSAADITSGNVDLILTAVSCTSVSDTINFSVTPAPDVSTTPHGNICYIDTVQTAGSVTNATGGQWTSLGGGTFLPDATDLNARYIPSLVDINNNEVVLILESTGNGTCISDTDTLRVIIDPVPELNSGSDRIICASQDTITLNAQIQDATGISWTSNGTGTFDNSGSLNTFYNMSNADRQLSNLILTLNASNVGTCNPPSTDVIIFGLTPSPSVDIGEDELACELDAGLRVFSNPVNTSSVVWTTNGTGNFDTPNDIKATYIFTAADAAAGSVQIYAETSSGNNCPEDRDTLTLNIYPVPTIDSMSNMFFCGVIPTVNLNAVTTLATDWSWGTLNGNGSFSPTDTLPSVDYIATAADTIQDSVNIEFSATINGNCYNQTEFTIYFEQPPIMTLESTPACVGETIVLDGLPGNFTMNEFSKFNWYQDGVAIAGISDTTRFLNVTATGTYRVEYQADDCLMDDDATVTFNPVPVTDNIDETGICNETTAFITLDAGPGTSYLWEEGSQTTQTIDITEPMDYVFQVFNEFNCSTSDTIIVRNLCPPRVFVPTIFTPNLDGENDGFYVTGAHFENFELIIFNRWGEIIFRTNDYTEAWDGTYRGEEMPIGVYNWRVLYEGTEGSGTGLQSLKGNVTLVR